MGTAIKKIKAARILEGQWCTLDNLLAEREIYRKLVGFFRTMDARNWVALDDITTDEVSSDFCVGILERRVALAANMRSFLDDCR